MLFRSAGEGEDTPDARGDGADTLDTNGDEPTPDDDIPAEMPDVLNGFAVLKRVLGVPVPLVGSLASPLDSLLESALDCKAGGSDHGEAAMMISGDAGLRYRKPSAEPPCAAEYLPLKIVLNKK